MSYLGEDFAGEWDDSRQAGCGDGAMVGPKLHFNFSDEPMAQKPGQMKVSKGECQPKLGAAAFYFFAGEWVDQFKTRF